jgi:hypothetical protein
MAKGDELCFRKTRFEICPRPPEQLCYFGNRYRNVMLEILARLLLSLTLLFPHAPEMLLLIAAFGPAPRR